MDSLNGMEGDHSPVMRSPELERSENLIRLSGSINESFVGQRV